jgi:hypothetical protein
MRQTTEELQDIEWDVPGMSLPKSLLDVQFPPVPKELRIRLADPSEILSRSVEFTTSRGRTRTGIVKRVRSRGKVHRLSIWCPRRKQFFSRDLRQVQVLPINL